MILRILILKIQLWIVGVFSKTPWHFIDVEKFVRHQGLICAVESRKCSMEYYISMKRRDGREEFIHSERVAQINIYHMLKVFPFWHRIFRSTLMDKLVSAIYFHDVPENISLNAIEDIKRSFGNVVSMWTWKLTRKEKLGESNSEYFLGILSNIIVILAKLGDRLHNLRNMKNNLGIDDFFTEERLKDQIDETWEKFPRLISEALKRRSMFRPVVVNMYKELIDALYFAELALEEKRKK